jgi:hypothetical protein
MLIKESSKRLKIPELKGLSHFKDIDWDKLEREELSAPFQSL